MRYLITGAAGRLGTAVLSALSSRTAVRAIDVAFPESLRIDYPHVEFMAGDLRDETFVSQAVDGATALLHLAPQSTRLGSDTESLDHATRGTYQLAIAAAAAGIERIVLGSTLELFGDLWMRYAIDEGWRPRPRPHLDQLCTYLAEVTLREVTRETSVPAFCLRFGHIVDDSMVARGTRNGQIADPRWIHVDDALAATLRALEVAVTGWQVRHISAAGQQAAVPNVLSLLEPFAYAPAHSFLGPDDTFGDFSNPLPAPISSRPIRRVVVFGAGGPLGAAVAEALWNDYELRLADIRSAEEAAADDPQSPGAPLPTPPHPPHEWLVVDMRDADQVMAACDGMDAIVNCSVLRHDPAGAFRVNAMGAYHVMRAAVAHSIKRIVHTGPYLIAQEGPAGYGWDDWIVDDVPPRPGIGWVYIPSKLLGKEICRIYAETYGLEVPALAFVHLRNPAVSTQGPDAPAGWRLSPFSVSWMDAARSVRAGLEVSELPSPFEFIHIGAELPHGVYSMQKAKRVLGWVANDYFEDCYARK